jgi:hypothetical protein
MVFPVWITFGCLMSLDICEAYVAGLAMSLFGVEIERVGSATHPIKMIRKWCTTCDGGLLLCAANDILATLM